MTRKGVKKSDLTYQKYFLKYTPNSRTVKSKVGLNDKEKKVCIKNKGTTAKVKGTTAKVKGTTAKVKGTTASVKRKTMKRKSDNKYVSI